MSLSKRLSVNLAFHQTNDFLRLEKLCTEESVNCEEILSLSEIHESAEAECEAALVRSRPGLRVGVRGEGREVLACNTHCLIEDDSTNTVNEVAGFHDSFETEQVLDNTSLDVVRCASDSVLSKSHCLCEVSWVQHDDATVSRNVVELCDCMEVCKISNV